MLLDLFYSEKVNYRGYTDTNDRTNVKVTHGMALKQRNNVINLNSTLANAFLPEMSQNTKI